MADRASPPVCSVVIPAWNAARLLPDCLAALRNQTMDPADFEVIVADDGSSDATTETARALGAACVSQPHRGPAAARNLGARLARGRVLAFLDADCRAEPGWLQALVRALDARAEDGVVGVQGLYATRQTRLVARFAQAEFEDRYDVLRAGPFIDLVATYSAAYLRTVFWRAGGFDERFPRADNEDTELSYRLLAQGRFLALAPDAVVRHLHVDSVWGYLRLKCRRGYWRTQVYRLYPAKALGDRYTTLPVKLETLAAMAWLGGSFAGALALPLAGGALLGFAQACPVAMLALAWPLTRKNWRKDRAVGAVTPFMTLVRGVALACGVLWGLARPAPGLGETP